MNNFNEVIKIIKMVLDLNKDAKIDWKDLCKAVEMYNKFFEQHKDIIIRIAYYLRFR